MKVLWSILITLLIAAAPAAAHVADGKEHTCDNKIGILLVAFGSSEASAQVSFEKIDQKVKAAYPDIPVRWAFTSHIIRAKMAKQGQPLDSVEIALSKMLDEKFTHVAVQSLQTIPGAEYHDLGKTIAAFGRLGGFKHIALGNPLLGGQPDMERTVDAILANIPDDRSPGDAVLLMGHGTHHPSDAFYAAMMFQLQLKDPNVFMGTVEGYPDIELIISLLQKKKVKKAYLMPFMSVAGDHAKNDMAGDEPDSWKSMLVNSGIECIPVLKGTAENDAFVDIWVDHLGEPLGLLTKKCPAHK